MSISLGTLSFGVEADTSKLDKDLDKSEKKISRFSMLGVQRFNSLNSFNINAGLKKMDSLNNKLQKTQRESQNTINEIQELENQMNKIKARIAETSGLNITYDKSQGTSNRMTTTQYQSKLDELALEDKEYQKLLNKQIKLTQKSEEQAMAIGRTKEQMAGLNTQITKASTHQGISNTFSGIGKNLKSAVSSIGKAIKNTLKWSAVFFGIGGAISLISRGVNSYLNTNKQLKADIDYMVFAIGQALAPVIQWVVNLFRNLLGLVGAIAQVFFGVNLFANSFSNYMKSANKSSGKIKKNLGALAGFDEINNIGGDTTTNSGASAADLSGIKDINKMVEEWIPKITRVKELLNEWKDPIKAIGIGFAGWKIGDIVSKLTNLTGMKSLKVQLGLTMAFSGTYLWYKGSQKLIDGDISAKSIGEALSGVGLTGLGVALATGSWKLGLIATIVQFSITFSCLLKQKFQEWFTKKWNEWTGMGLKWENGLLKTEINPLFLLNLVLKWNSKKQNKQEANNIGKDIVDGISLGMSFATGNIGGVITWIAQKISGAFCDFFGIHSPSKLMQGYGQYIMQGLLNGITNMKSTVLTNISTLCGNLKNTFNNGINNIKNIWNNLGKNLKTPKIKMPHINVTYTYSGFKAEAAKLLGLPGWPNFGIQWYKNGGVFGGTSVIGVGEYAGARSNPEIVAPQNMIYQTTKEAIRDTNNFSRNNEQKLIHLTVIANGKQTFNDILEAGREYERMNGVKIFATES